MVIQIVFVAYQRLVVLGKSTWTVAYLSAHIAASAMAFFVALVLTVFATFAGSGAFYPYANGIFGFAVTVIFCIFLGGLAA